MMNQIRSRKKDWSIDPSCWFCLICILILYFNSFTHNIAKNFCMGYTWPLVEHFMYACGFMVKIGSLYFFLFGNEYRDLFRCIILSIRKVLQVG